jgi:hypothetical protein
MPKFSEGSQVSSRMGRIGVRRIGARQGERFLRDPDPSSKIRDCDQAPGEEEAYYGQDAHKTHIPPISLGKSNADARNLTADDGSNQRLAGHKCS